jgi:hypothetical protein
MTTGARFGEQRSELRRGRRVIETTPFEFNDHVTKPRGTRELRALTRQALSRPTAAYDQRCRDSQKAERPTPLFEA